MKLIGAVLDAGSIPASSTISTLAMGDTVGCIVLFRRSDNIGRIPFGIAVCF